MLRKLSCWVIVGAVLGALTNCGGAYTQTLGDAAGGSSSGNKGSSNSGASSGGRSSASGGLSSVGGHDCNTAGIPPEWTDCQAGRFADGSSAAFLGCETDCVLSVFGVKPTGCKICHDSGANGTLKSALLDLVSPQVSLRLKDVPAKHTDITTMGFNVATDCPHGDLLIDSANVEASWLLKKVRGQQGKCGDKQPSTMALTPVDQQCVETYIYCVAAN